MKRRLKRKVTLVAMVLIFTITMGFVLANGVVTDGLESGGVIITDEATEKLEANVVVHEIVGEYTREENETEGVMEAELEEVATPVTRVDDTTTANVSADFPFILSHNESLSYLVLVNREFRLADDFTPHDLSVVNVQSLNGEHLLRVAAARAAEELFTEAHEAGHFLLATSGYRSFTTQVSTHHYWINVLGLEEAKRVSARPGHSEHQLGLALDLSTHILGGYLSEDFSLTPEGIWVRNNAHRFGFIIRYPRNREADTGFTYEPWHIRYVGIDAATEIFNSGMILEEFLEN